MDFSINSALSLVIQDTFYISLCLGARVRGKVFLVEYVLIMRLRLTCVFLDQYLNFILRTVATLKSFNINGVESQAVFAL